MMLTENFVAATLTANKAIAHTSSVLKDVGIFIYEFQPQCTFRQGFKKSSVQPSCLAVSSAHIFAAQADKAVVNVYSREKRNQEATVPFPAKIKSICYADKAAVLIVGSEDGKLMLWETATGRVSVSAASHLQAVSHLSISEDNSNIISASSESIIHVWSLSQLLEFAVAAPQFESNTPSNAPVRSFANHQTAITTLATGHSTNRTNFAVSSSEDKTCYLWHLETCQVLRTILLPHTPVSSVLDPADRAIYFGCSNGAIQQVDLYGPATKTSRTSIFDIVGVAPIQLSDQDSWNATSELGSAQCITLSYDATILLSGHTTGSIIRWDVAKHRVVSEVANLHQPISFLGMLRPIALGREDCAISVSAVMKPNLELSVVPETGTLGIPPAYSLYAQIIDDTSSIKNSDDDTYLALTQPGIPQSLLDDALYAMSVEPVGGKVEQNTTQRDMEAEVQLKKLKENNETLQGRIDEMLRLEQKRRERYVERAKHRQEFGMQKRQAYFAAEGQGKNGDEAMLPFQAKERALDVESEEEYLNTSSMEVDN